MEIYWLAGGGVAVAALIASFHIQVQQHRRLARFEERLAHLTASISLLTDTAEGGLRDVAHEIERLAALSAPPAPRSKARAATQRRVSTATKRGRSVQDIAAKEQMSEGEVRLRMQMSGAKRDKVHHAAVR